ncbi:hypothetical protein [Neptuniibacter sp. 1_MG-2023]|uniref:hypothetical protein n=1 Tax=Neptuniibacter sp. 1_MG-2023 TaxID=3062662 RepID=UPI0026E18BDA|nr:hypothetical protein [Neptuniibacter sp. 1_MG-2023]MDO6594371.1 hypothetical protein [Neptuniibacter sp. 1_MG-2023]
MSFDKVLKQSALKYQYNYVDVLFCSSKQNDASAVGEATRSLLFNLNLRSNPRLKW